MNLNNARYILTILEEGSLSAAARKLYISQPALSQTIRQVENSLGTPIFDRNVRKLKLTYAGQKYVETARQMLILEHNLRNEINEIQKENTGFLRFGIPKLQGPIILPAVLQKFKKKYPNVMLQIEEKGSSTLEEMIGRGDLDIALARTVKKHNSIAYHLVQKERMGLLAGKGNKIFEQYPNGTELDITDALDESFVYLKEGHSARTFQDKLISERKITLKKLIELDSFETAKQVALDCGAVMITPLSFIMMDAQALNKAHLYPLKGIENSQHTYIIYHKKLYLTQYMKYWIKLICEFYSKI
ncbi:MAG: LysR family transcriptional regulator [Clostridiales bacterium]|nr:LysR family transcriptional regulator [Clostridiales bacterium]